MTLTKKFHLRIQDLYKSSFSDLSPDQIKYLQNNVAGKFYSSSTTLRTALLDSVPPFTSKQISVIIAKSYRYKISRLFKFASKLIRTIFPSSTITPCFLSTISVNSFFLFFRLRIRFFFFVVYNKLTTGKQFQFVTNENAYGFDHNFSQLLDFSTSHRNRTERLMNVLKSLDGIDIFNASILSVGPRNEAELLLLKAHGFSNIQSIDLFTYSPLIKPMDMNFLAYPDNTFDVYYSSAVIKYSPDISKTIEESLRVVKPGGLMCFMFTYGSDSNLIPSGSSLAGGSNDLLKLFHPHVKNVIYKWDWFVSEGDYRCQLIFSV